MPRGKRKHPSKKKQQIVQTAAALFARHGFRRVTVEEICRTAGASKMTFYKYFPNKLELLRYIWNEMIEAGYEKLYELDARDIPFREKMQAIIDYKIELGSKMSREYIDELLGGAPEIQNLWKEIQAKSYGLFADFVTKAQRRGDIRKMRLEFFMAVLNKLHELVQDEQLRSIYPDHSDFIREVNNLFFFGILPPGSQEDSHNA
jgi:AcrR family transcriptional regulator